MSEAQYSSYNAIAFANAQKVYSAKKAKSATYELMSEAQYNGRYNAIKSPPMPSKRLFCKEGEASATYELMSEAQYICSYNAIAFANAQQGLFCKEGEVWRRAMS